MCWFVDVQAETPANEVVAGLFDARAKTTQSRATHVFNGKGVPEISLLDYLDRLTNWMDRQFGESGYGEQYVLITAFMVNRLLANTPGAFLTVYNQHRLVAGCLLLVLKYHEDDLPADKNMASVFGVELQELCKLETAAFRLLGYSMCCHHNLATLRRAIYAEYSKRGRKHGRAAGGAPRCASPASPSSPCSSCSYSSSPDFEIEGEGEGT